jgi:hypothetical protein
MQRKIYVRICDYWSSFNPDNLLSIRYSKLTQDKFYVNHEKDSKYGEIKQSDLKKVFSKWQVYRFRSKGQRTFYLENSRILSKYVKED